LDGKGRHHNLAHHQLFTLNIREARIKAAIEALNNGKEIEAVVSIPFSGGLSNILFSQGDKGNFVFIQCFNIDRYTKTNNSLIFVSEDGTRTIRIKTFNILNFSFRIKC
jgi:hypothetical protein